MTGRLGIIIVAALVCGGVALAANPHEPQKHFTAADQAYARRLAVVRSDLAGSGWTATRSRGARSGQVCKSFDPDQSDLVETGEGYSPYFTRAGSSVASTAAVYKTASDAQAAWSRVLRVQLLQCLEEGLSQVTAGGVTIDVLSKARLQLGQLAPRARAFRMRLLYDFGAAAAVPATLDIVGLGSGRANVTLIAQSAGAPLRPLPSGLEAALERTLARRLKD